MAWLITSFFIGVAIKCFYDASKEKYESFIPLYTWMGILNLLFALFTAIGHLL